MEPDRTITTIQSKDDGLVRRFCFHHDTSIIYYKTNSKPYADNSKMDNKTKLSEKLFYKCFGSIDVNDKTRMDIITIGSKDITNTNIDEVKNYIIKLGTSTTGDSITEDR